ncbi:putative vacuolar protein sorting-associated protein TDA6 [Amphibalanus amphitrite]|uniref:putative vacuolar protein sorting-associated protein TDA6 n=1 Tax=Amphibalanus amphitrite TaxID=1232801 RepID=UPI001C91BCF3|nr:putative vacuolar protein sorting-associated protein TDA6 [Amphibalanus amphitrite]XP_043194628.1 putative vacuolar protein sorting-associated protein TDA6 [Amphibalanus amphitrite]
MAELRQPRAGPRTPLLLLTPLLHLLTTVHSGAEQVSGDALVDQLVAKHAPLLFLHPDERWFPGDVLEFISHVHVQDGSGQRRPVVDASLPVGSRSLDTHLVTSLPPGLGTEQVRPPPHLRGTSPATRPVPVYVTVSRCDTGQPTADLLPSFTATYWMFHPFSEGKKAAGRLRGSHVGDWEHVSLQVQYGEPVSLYISAHEFGAYYNYNRATNLYQFASQVNRGGFPVSPQYPPTLQVFRTHPVLYVARGSHGLWPSAGTHVYSRLAHLSDVTAAGTPWKTWQQLELLHRRPPQWLSFLGRWGNPAGCWHLLGALCALSGGPTGIPLKEADFQCPAEAGAAAEPGTGRGRVYPSRWVQLLGRR